MRLGRLPSPGVPERAIWLSAGGSPVAISDTVSVVVWLPRAAARRPERVALESGGETLTYAELLARAEARKGVALAFGPGLAAEGFRFERAP